MKLGEFEPQNPIDGRRMRVTSASWWISILLGGFALIVAAVGAFWLYGQVRNLAARFGANLPNPGATWQMPAASAASNPGFPVLQ